MPNIETRTLVNEAVFGHQGLEKASLLDRLFARLFSGLVYTQIWEDPSIDLEAMDIKPHHKIVTISSGGCNALSYLIADPASIHVVDLNGSHLSLLELKMAAFQSIDDYRKVEQYFAHAKHTENIELYDRLLRWQLSTTARVYWNSKVAGKRRIEMFANGFYRYGLLGQFIRFMNNFAKMHGVDLKGWSQCRSNADQVLWFNTAAPKLFNSTVIRVLCRSPLVLYHLGIPPRQFHELCEGRPEMMIDVLRERARALLTIGTVDDNYFAWQATTGGYRLGGPYPPYLRHENFNSVRNRVSRISLHQKGVRQHLQSLPGQSVDRVVLLDAQDWMDHAEINRLWTEITRTARPGSRVIFRTAGLIWRAATALPDGIASQWETDEEANKAYTARDMSGIYGRFHLYRFRQ